MVNAFKTARFKRLLYIKDGGRKIKIVEISFGPGGVFSRPGSRARAGGLFAPAGFPQERRFDQAANFFPVPPKKC